MGTTHIKRYSMNWNEGGISQKNEEHQTYIHQFVSDFVDNLKVQIEEAWKLDESNKMTDLAHVVTKNKDAKSQEEKRRKNRISQEKKKEEPPPATSTRITKKHKNAKVLSNARKKIFSKTSKIDDVLSGNVAALWSSDEDVTAGNVVDLWVTRFALKKEVLHHLHFCKKKCDVFCGREAEQAAVKNLMVPNEKTKPIVVSAPSGAGKTAFMAMIAKQTKIWFGQNCATVIRFLGTTPASSSIQQVLQSICEQISDIYSETIPGHVDRMTDLVSLYLSLTNYNIIFRHLILSKLISLFIAN